MLLKNFLISTLLLLKIIKSKKREFTIILNLSLNILLSTTIFNILVIVSNLVILINDYQQRLITNQQLITNRFSILRAFISRIKREINIVRKFCSRRHRRLFEYLNFEYSTTSNASLSKKKIKFKRRYIRNQFNVLLKITSTFSKKQL